MATPAAAAVWASPSSVAWRLASLPKTSAWANNAPFSLDHRWTKPVVRPNLSAVVVKMLCNVLASCATLVIRRLLLLIQVVRTLMIKEKPSVAFLSLMPMPKSP